MHNSDRTRQQISRPFVHEVSSASQWSERERAYPELSDDLSFEDLAFPVTNYAALLPEDPPPDIQVQDLPAYMQKALRKRSWKSKRITSTVLISIGFCVLLATSIGILLLMGTRPTSIHPQPKGILHTPNVQVHSPTASPLHLSTTQVTFDAFSGDVASKTITLENTSSGQVTWQENCDHPWLKTSVESGTFAKSQNIQVTVNRGGLTPGDYTGHVTFWLRGQKNITSVLTVTMSTATSPAQLSISAPNLSYATVQSQAPYNQVITLRNTTGRQALHWSGTATTQDGAHWLTLSPSHGTLSAGDKQQITVKVAPGTLAIGTYTGLISFTGDANAQVGVSLTVVAPGNLVISPSSLAFTTQQTSQSLSLQNNGGQSLDWTVQPSTNDGGNWLDVKHPKGTLDPGKSITLTVLADPTNLTPGTYQGTLTFSAGNQIQDVSVSFTISQPTPTPTPTPNPTPTPTPTATSTAISTSTATSTSTAVAKEKESTR